MIFSLVTARSFGILSGRLTLHPASTVVKLFLTIVSYLVQGTCWHAGHFTAREATTMLTAPCNTTSPKSVNSALNKVAPKFPISVVALRAEAYSFDDKSVIISVTTKYSSAERTYSVPLECFHDIVVDLQRLNALAETTVEER